MSVKFVVSDFVPAGAFAAGFRRGARAFAAEAASHPVALRLAFGSEKPAPRPTADEIDEALRRDAPWWARVDWLGVWNRMEEFRRHA